MKSVCCNIPFFHFSCQFLDASSTSTTALINPAPCNSQLFKSWTFIYLDLLLTPTSSYSPQAHIQKCWELGGKWQRRYENLWELLSDSKKEPSGRGDVSSPFLRQLFIICSALPLVGPEAKQRVEEESQV